MKLSDHFTLEELCKSQEAVRRGIDNTPDPETPEGREVIESLRRVCAEILEPVRVHFGKPFSPSSGYRSPALNEAIGGSKNSQHMKGQAADFEVPGVPNHELAAWVRDNRQFDQLILEFYTPGQPKSGWVHCSLKAEANRQQALTINKSGRTDGLVA